MEGKSVEWRMYMVLWIYKVDLPGRCPLRCFAGDLVYSHYKQAEAAQGRASDWTTDAFQRHFEHNASMLEDFFYSLIE